MTRQLLAVSFSLDDLSLLHDLLEDTIDDLKYNGDLEIAQDYLRLKYDLEKQIGKAHAGS